MNDITQDPRYSYLSDQGKSELEVYLNWLSGAQLHDTEYAFVAYVMGRAQLKDPRHLYAIWEHHMGGQCDRATKTQIRRFFMCPSTEVAFNTAQSAGWFDFVPWVYHLLPEVPQPNVPTPSFVKVGNSELPYR